MTSYKTETGKTIYSNEKHSSGCSPSCNGTYYYGGNYGSSQPHSKPCWCHCHNKKKVNTKGRFAMIPKKGYERKGWRQLKKNGDD